MLRKLRLRQKKNGFLIKKRVHENVNKEDDEETDDESENSANEGDIVV